MLLRIFALKRFFTAAVPSAIACAVCYAICACVVTWPLLRYLPTHLPLGAEPTATVPLFNLWTLRWNADRLRVGYAGYWDAPIFAPAQGTFALSEPQPLTGLLFAIINWLAGNDVLAYNLVLLIILTLNGVCGYLLLRRLAIPRAAAFLGGFWAVALPFVAHESGVLQLAVLFPMLLALAALLDCSRQVDLAAALRLGGWTAATWLTCGYYGLFLSIFTLLGAAMFFTRAHLRRAVVGNLLVGAALASFLLLPVLPSQAQRTAGYTRSTTTIGQNSAQLVDYARAYERTWGARALPRPQLTGGSGEPLFPGVGLLLLALLGSAEGWRAGQRRWVAFCLLGAGVALLLSLGLNLRLGDRVPYELLRAYYPGFRQLRSPYRLAVVVQIFLLMLAAFGLARIWRWRAPIGRWLAVGVSALCLFEQLIIPMPLYRVPDQRLHADWMRWLATQPAGAAAMVPFPASGRVEDYQPTTIAMLQSLVHAKPLANGYSGFFPPDYLNLRAAMLSFPDDRSLARLRQSQVSYIVIDRQWATAQRMRALRRHTDIRVTYMDALVVICQFL